MAGLQAPGSRRTFLAQAGGGAGAVAFAALQQSEQAAAGRLLRS